MTELVAKYTYHVRDLLDFEEDDIWALTVPSLMNLTFDNGETVLMDTPDVQLSWYYWQIASAYRELQITRELCLEGEHFTDKLNREKMWIAIEATMGFDIDKEDIWLLAYQSYNRQYNAMVTRLIAYVTGTSAPDIIELINDPEIKAANDNITDDLSTIERAYETVSSVIRSGKYQNNPIVRAVLNRTVKMDQALQSLSARGRCTDIDSVIYRRPVKLGYAMGIGGPADYAKDTRSSSKSSLFNKDPVAASEYFNRKLQLVCNVIRRLVVGDCGTTDAHEVPIPLGATGKKVIAGLAGLNQVMPDGTLREIRSSDHELLGTTIKFRSSLCCREAKNQKVCSTCYGIISYAIPHDTNPGHVSCTSINKRVTQLIISTKHLDFIVHSFMAILRGNEPRYFTVKKTNPEDIFMAPETKHQNIRLMFPVHESENLVDINYVSNVENIKDISNISALSQVELFTIDPDGEVKDVELFDMVRLNTKASLSVEMLRYIKNKGWTKHNSNYVVDLSDWSPSLAAFTYPNKHESTSEYRGRVEAFIRSERGTYSEDDSKPILDVKKYKRVPMLASYNDVDTALMDAFYLISEKLDSVMIGHIATILLATRAADPANHNWDMPNSLRSGMFVGHNDILRHRSLGPALLFERQSQIFDDVSCYIYHKRLVSPNDAIVYIAKQKR